MLITSISTFLASMNNIMILGSGRSGTSMVAGCLSGAGYFMGDDLWGARDSNPYGFFEDREINEINEELLEPVVPRRRRFLGIEFSKHQPVKWQRWLACLPGNLRVPAAPALVERIKRVVQRQPYCLKDPRFSYTLPVWRPFLSRTAFVCVFRDPGRTATSIYNECLAVPHLADPKTGISISTRQAVRIWTSIYSPIIYDHRHQGDWLFLHYDQAFTPEGLDRLQKFTGAKVDRSFPTAKLSRSKPLLKIPKNCRALYQELCKLADYLDPELA